jgi:hypothetical protein
MFIFLFCVDGEREVGNGKQLRMCYGRSFEIIRGFWLMYPLIRLEKRRKAMLEMPQMVQTWKEVRMGCMLYGVYEANANCREVMVVDGSSGRRSRELDIWLYYCRNGLYQYYTECRKNAYCRRWEQIRLYIIIARLFSFQYIQAPTTVRCYI